MFLFVYIVVKNLIYNLLIIPEFLLKKNGIVYIAHTYTKTCRFCLDSVECLNTEWQMKTLLLFFFCNTRIRFTEKNSDTHTLDVRALKSFLSLSTNHHIFICVSFGKHTYGILFTISFYVYTYIICVYGQCHKRR